MNAISLECPACFSLRRVSPFQSPLQVIEVPAGRALSTDGIHWQIQLLAEIRVMEISGAERVGWRYFAYGHWAAAIGFMRVPANPVLGDQAHNPSLHPLLETLATRPQLPFPTRDPMELWLLDRFEKLPLALLRSAARGTLLPVPRDADWLPTAHSDTSFVSPTLAGTAAGNSPWPHRDILTRRVACQGRLPGERTMVPARF